MPDNRPDDRPETVTEIATGSGPARVRVRLGGRQGLLCLGHGAGGGVDAADLVATSATASAAGWTVALVEQPYRVAGRRMPERAPRLDAAWVAVVEAVRAQHPSGPLVVGGRSSGARVAARTSQLVGAAGVVCLAFPLHPPGRDQSRLPELLAVDVPCLVVQGDRDPFGSGAEIKAQVGAAVTVVSMASDHSLRRCATAAAAAVMGWLDQLVV